MTGEWTPESARKRLIHYTSAVTGDYMLEDACNDLKYALDALAAERARGARLVEALTRIEHRNPVAQREELEPVPGSTGRRGTGKLRAVCGDCWQDWPRELTDAETCVYCIARAALAAAERAGEVEA